MSSFIAPTRRKDTNDEFRDAYWHDDAFGRHNYGVQFVGSSYMENANMVEFEIKDEDKTEINKTEELFDRVVKWGRARKIDNPNTQLNKVLEEVGEIAHELSRGHIDSDEIRDAIGDSMITLIIFADILDIDAIECIEDSYEVIKDRKGKLVNGGFVKDE